MVKPDGRRKPKTQEEKDNLSKKTIERLAREKAEKEAKKKTESASGNGNATHKGFDGADHGGPVTSCSLCDNYGGGGDRGGDHGDKSKTGTGRKIPNPKDPKNRTEQATEVVLDKGKILAGLPSFYILVFKAVNNILKLLNFFLPLQVLLDDITPQEAELINSIVKPTFEKNLKFMGEDHPYLVCGAVGGVVLVGKLKFLPKKKKGAGEVIDVEAVEIDKKKKEKKEEDNDGDE
jgi:hypothetical protein